MWDEKQFFDDFVKESEQIQPSAEFVNKMKNLSKEPQQAGVKKKSATPKVITGVLAAAAVVGIIIMTGVEQKPKEMTFPKDNVYADKEESHIIQGDLSEVWDENRLLLENALADDKVLVKDEEGRELTIEEREVLLARIANAEVTDISSEKFDGKEAVIYYVEGEEEIRFSIIEEEYLIIEEVVYSINK